VTTDVTCPGQLDLLAALEETTLIRDDFAGPGGWEQGLRLLGHTGPVIGVEHDQAACDTARAAGFDRIHGDVRADGPTDFAGYIASPPCQTFSAAGKGSGRKHLDHLLQAVRRVTFGMTPHDAVAWVGDAELDERSVLVLEPLNTIRDHRPRWVALEQVPAVLPIWQAYVEALSSLGYIARTGLLQAEQYGVPQTRKRAVLVAVRQDVADAHGLTGAPWPTPTHSKFYSRDRTRLDDGVLPWVSMAAALGAEAGGSISTGNNSGMGGGATKPYERSSDVPSPTLTGNVSRWQLAQRRGAGSAERGGVLPRDLTEPAMTVTGGGGHGSASLKWQFAGAGATARYTAGQVPRDLDEPAHGITGKGTAAWTPTAALDGDNTPLDWTEQRPSPTIVGSFRADVVAAPGYRKPGDPPRQKTPGSVRVTVEEAGVLQSFPRDYPWQGTSTKRYQQVGNAIPPLLAAAVLAPLLALLAPFPAKREVTA